MIRRLTAAVIVGTIILLGAEQAGATSLIYVAKPAVTILIGLIAWAGRPEHPGYRHRLLVGIALSLAGDVFLMLPGSWFVPGLGCFLGAHLAYISAFAAGSGMRLAWAALLPFAAFAAAFLGALWPGLGGMAGPVSAYVGAIVVMAWQAWGRALERRTAAALLAAVGAVFFVASDAILAWNRFRAPLAWAGWAITVTYVTAQWLIARSADEIAGRAGPA